MGKEKMKMGLISLKCSFCGADLEVDDSRKLYFCTYCGNKMVLENSSDSAAKDSPTVLSLLERADQLVKQGNIVKAVEYYERVLEIEPLNEKANIAMQPKYMLTFYRKKQFNTWGESIDAEIELPSGIKKLVIFNGESDSLRGIPLGRHTITLIHPFLSSTWKLKFEADIAKNANFYIRFSRVDNFPVLDEANVPIFHSRKEI